MYSCLSGGNMFRWVTAAFKNLFFGKSKWYFRVLSFLSFVGVIGLAYIGWIYIWSGDSKLNMCIQNREADQSYQAELLAEIQFYKEKLASTDKSVVFVDRPIPPPPPTPIPPKETGVIARAKEIVAVTAPQIKETVTQASSKIFTDRRVGIGYIGTHSIDGGMSHGVYVRYDILSLFGKSLNVGLGAIYSRHDVPTMMGMPPVRKGNVGFVIMGGIEL